MAVAAGRARIRFARLTKVRTAKPTKRTTVLMQLLLTTANPQPKLCALTFFIGITGYRSIWMMADRRLSSGARVIRDDAIKLFLLDGADNASGILTYAGLGATSRGNQPSDWMARVLRGMRLTFEDSMTVLRDAIAREVPPHLKAFPREQQGHIVFANAFFGREPRAYSIDLLPVVGGAGHAYRCTRRFLSETALPRMRPSRITLGGSGALQFIARPPAWWQRERREILSLIRAAESRKVPPEEVASRLARVNCRISALDRSVGPRSIVAWRFRDAVPNPGHAAFVRETQEDAPRLPTISAGMDVNALFDAVLPSIRAARRARKAGASEKRNDEELVAAFRSLPDSPDEKLR